MDGEQGGSAAIVGGKSAADQTFRSQVWNDFEQIILWVNQSMIQAIGFLDGEQVFKNLFLASR